jgi:uroporphyrinogen decarboxylase
MVQGKGDGAFKMVIDAAITAPEKFDAFINLLADTTTLYLSKQIEHGADAVQIFDSWAGLLPDPWFSRWVIRPTQRIVQTLKKLHPDTPIIGFPRAAGALYPLYAKGTGVDGLGVDQGMAMDEAARLVPANVCLQGNLAPELLLQGGAAMKAEAEKILNAMKGRPFIFNLGHGVIKETPPEHVAELSKIIRDFRR